VVVAPHGSLAAGDFVSFRNMVPAVGAVIDGVEEKALVLGIGGKVGLGEKSPSGGQSSGEICLGGFFVAFFLEDAGESEKALGGDGGGGAIDGFMFIERIGGAVEVIAEMDEARGASIPVRNAVGGSFPKVEVGGDAGDFEIAIEDLLFPSKFFEFGFREKIKKFVLFRETAEEPGVTAGPGGKGGVALLGGRAAVGAVGDIKNGFMNNATWNVVSVATFTVVDIVTGGGFGVLQGAMEEIDFGVVFSHEPMTENVGKTESAKRANGIGEERLRAVERADVAEVRGELGPAGGLDGAAGFEGEIVEVGFPIVRRETTFAEESAQIAVSADIVEAVIVDPDVGDVDGHSAEGGVATDLEHRFISGGIVLEDGRAVDEAFGPLGPPAGGVFSLDGEDGGTVRLFPSFLEGEDFWSGSLKNLFGGSLKTFGGEGGIALDHKIKIDAGGTRRRC